MTSKIDNLSKTAWHLKPCSFPFLTFHQGILELQGDSMFKRLCMHPNKYENEHIVWHGDPYIQRLTSSNNDSCAITQSLLLMSSTVNPYWSISIPEKIGWHTSHNNNNKVLRNLLPGFPRTCSDNPTANLNHQRQFNTQKMQNQHNQAPCKHIILDRLSKAQTPQKVFCVLNVTQL